MTDIIQVCMAGICTDANYDGQLIPEKVAVAAGFDPINQKHTVRPINCLTEINASFHKAKINI